MSRISLLHQAGALRAYFPQSTVKRDGEQSLIWVGKLQPSALGGIYTVKLHYSRKDGVAVYVLDPKLLLAKGATALPHVYSTPKQQLCLYYPPGNEWNPGMWFVQSIIPWASEWLYHYELWIATDGKWLGGGIDHNPPQDKSINQQDLVDGTT